MSFMPPERRTSNTTKSSFIPPEYRTSDTTKRRGWMNKRTWGISIRIAFGLLALFVIMTWLELRPKVGVGEYGKLAKPKAYWDACFLAKSPDVYKKAWDLVMSDQPDNIKQLDQMQNDGEITSYYPAYGDGIGIKVQVLQTMVPGDNTLRKIKIVDDIWPFDDREWYVYTECVLPAK